jgi:hypothetical protein
MNQYETPVIHKNLKKYRRQYFGYTDDKNNQILFINCFWKNKKEFDAIWLNQKINVLGEGSYFWSVKYNITENKLFDLDINGEI